MIVGFLLLIGWMALNSRVSHETLAPLDPAAVMLRLNALQDARIIHVERPTMPFLVFPPSYDAFTSAAIARNRVYGLYFTSLFEKVLGGPHAADRLVVDLGGNIGFHTCHAALLGHPVLVLEMDATNAALLRQNLAMNKIVPLVTVVEAAASDVTRTTIVDTAVHPGSPATHSLGSAQDMPWSTLTERRTVTMVRVADELEARGIDEVFLLKIDVEGHELKALQGFNPSAFKVQYIAMEFFPKLLKASGTDPVELLHYLLAQGYVPLKDDKVLFDQTSAADYVGNLISGRHTDIVWHWRP